MPRAAGAPRRKPTVSRGVPRWTGEVKVAGLANRFHTFGMQRAVTELPLRPQDEVECDRCAVHCEKVVYPAACVARSCPFLYAYEAFGHTYVGCMQKVYAVEIDLDLLQEAEAAARGFGAI